MALSPGWQAVATKLQEAEKELSHGEIHMRLSDALQDHLQKTGGLGEVLASYGDDKSGDVVYNHNGDTFKAPYEIGEHKGKPMCSINHGARKDVIPVVNYEEEATEGDDDAHISQMEAYIPGKSQIEVVERYISQEHRSTMAKKDFAGKGTSFPIENEEDFHNAMRALGRAGRGNFSKAAIRRRALAIAKRKGYDTSKYEQKESAAAPKGTLAIRESCAFPVDIQIREAFIAGRTIKLIAPGKGASAFYTAEVLRRDGPKIFKAGTPMCIDHPTRAEESDRPEGSVKNWGAVLATDARWEESHAQGPGLYAEVKPFADTADFIDERAPYAGVSIRANGNAVMEGDRPVLRDGVPLLAGFTSAESVDMVTRAGAGGMFLSESARPIPIQQGGDVELTEAKVKELIEAAVTPYRERALKGDAVVVASRVLSTVSFTDPQKQFVIDSVLRETLPMSEGKLDDKKFGEIVIAEAKRYGASIGHRGVEGMGVVPLSEAKKKEPKEDKEEKKECAHCEGSGEKEDGGDRANCSGTGMKESRRRRTALDPDEVEILEALVMDRSQAKAAVRGRVA